MKNYHRQNPSFSLCGLNCCLCTMKLGNYCPGCGGGASNQLCAIIRCSQKYDGIEYCFQCDEYPCDKYDGIDAYDSFITHRKQLKDLEKAKRIGIDAYNSELDEKVKYLSFLLNNYNDGRRKSFFCVSVNLLELKDLQFAVEKVVAETKSNDLTLKEKAKIAVSIFNFIAEKRNIVLKLKKKPKSKK